MATIFGQNRFFNINADAKSFSLEIMAEKIALIEGRLETLCAVKGNVGSSKEALNLVSDFKKQMTNILLKPLSVQENTPDLKSDKLIAHS